MHSILHMYLHLINSNPYHCTYFNEATSSHVWSSIHGTIVQGHYMTLLYSCLAALGFVTYLLTNAEISLFLEQLLNYCCVAFQRGIVDCCAAILYVHKHRIQHTVRLNNIEQGGGRSLISHAQGTLSCRLMFT